MLSLISLDNGGEKYVDKFCGKLTSDPTANSDCTNNKLIIAEIKEKIAEEGKDNLPARKNKRKETFMNTSDINLLQPTGTISHPKNGKHDKKLEDQHQKLKRKHISTKDTYLMKKKSRLLDRNQRYSSDLNLSDRLEVDITLDLDENWNEVLVRLNNDAIPINRQTMLTLWDGEWLDDNIIDGLFIRLRERDRDGENHYLSKQNKILSRFNCSLYLVPVSS